MRYGSSPHGFHMTTSIEFADRLRGGIYGLLVGDALGVPYEFHSPESLPTHIDMVPPEEFDRAHRGIAPGTWSDDGALALCLLASLLESNARGGPVLDPCDFARRLVDWYERGYLAVDGQVFDVGVQTAGAIARLRRGVDPLEAGASDERNNGNGSLMRVLPLALIHVGSDEELVRDAMLQSRLTHGHAQSRVACALYCLWVRQFLRGESGLEPVEAWRCAVASARSFFAQHVEERDVLERLIRPDEPAEGTGSGWVIDTLRSARMIVERGPSFEDAVVEAVRLGHDTDTTACVVGGIVGVRDGVGAIPERWMRLLRGRELAEPLIEKLVHFRCSSAGKRQRP